MSAFLHRLDHVRGPRVAAALALLLVSFAFAPDVVAQGTVPTKVDVNTADADALVAVPGIGPVTAKKIIESRQKDGPFKRVEDLLRVKGIGEKSLERLKPYVKVTAAPKKRSR